MKRVDPRIMACVLIGSAACHVPPTRRSHTEYAVETPRTLSDVDWELVSVRCGEGRPVSRAQLTMHVHAASEKDALQFTVKRASVGCSEEFVVRAESACAADEPCSRDTFVFREVQRISEAGACEQRFVLPTVVALTQSERTMTWVSLLDSLCGGVPARLVFEPHAHEE